MKTKSTFTVEKWDERDLRELPERMKIATADIVYRVSGEIDGHIIVHYLLFYSHFDKDDQHNSTSRYVGLLHFTGRLQGHEGTFVMEDNGTFSAGKAHAAVKIIEHSGTGALKSITGSGSYTADQNGFSIELEYQL